MTIPRCPKFDTCSAPLCPMDEQSLENGLWYPDEEVCTLKKHGGLPWIRKQRKLIKRAARVDRYFTLEMLERNCIVRGGIEGLDPDVPEELQLKRWLNAHPEKRKLSWEERERARQRMAYVRG